MSRLYIFPLLSFFLLAAACAQGNSEPFSQWLQEFRQEAALQGISESTLSAALDNILPDDRVIELDRKQPETKLTIDEYLTKTVTAKRIEEGRDQLEENHALLEEIGQKYGVQPRFIVALWGIETNYGQNTGGFETIASLATLAYDGRRADFFRGELLKSLQVIDAEHMLPSDLEGSWAGAMGQCQFMPSTYLNYAVDYDGDGKRDIWNSRADMFASIANYLKALGWNSEEGWGRPVQLPEHFDRALSDGSWKSLSEWQKLGVRKTDGSDLPAKNVNAMLVWVGDGDDARPYLICGNFKTLLKWNRSRYFATAVGTLADSIHP